MKFAVSAGWRLALTFLFESQKVPAKSYSYFKSTSFRPTWQKMSFFSTFIRSKSRRIEPEWIRMYQNKYTNTFETLSGQTAPPSRCIKLTEEKVRTQKRREAGAPRLPSNERQRVVCAQTIQFAMNRFVRIHPAWFTLQSINSKSNYP